MSILPLLSMLSIYEKLDCVRHLTYQLYALNELSLCRSHRRQMTWNCDPNTVKYCIVLLLFTEIREEIWRKDRKRKKKCKKNLKAVNYPKNLDLMLDKQKTNVADSGAFPRRGRHHQKLISQPIIFATFPEHCMKLNWGFVSLAVPSDPPMNCNLLILH